ncbi:MAG TPA: hypothetical protein VJV75_10475 [Candidatus Polarisedimenticolia bacterium]|nr:hypothetical protein [Candidatus Polarisedimenticolia bacterium]
MNLKAFHVAFISAAMLLFAGLGVWCLREHRDAGDGTGFVVGAVASFLASVGLFAYGVLFVRKARSL